MSLAQATQVRIYNRALGLLGSTAQVTNVDDGQAVTDTLNSLWDEAVRELLAEHPWNCCIKRAVLNRLAEIPAFGAGSCYRLPYDCLRWLPWSRDDCNWFDGTEEAGRTIVADTGEAPTINIRYVAAIADPAQWSPHMVTAMASLMAWHAAESITQSVTIADNMRRLYHGDDGDGGMLAKAREKDGLATGDRARGSIERRSRALIASASYTRYPRY